MSVPAEVALARAIRALRSAMLLLLSTALGLGVLAAAALVLAGQDGPELWPGLTTVLLGQFAALAGGATALVGLQRALRPGAVPEVVRSATAGWLRRIPRPLYAALVVATAAWTLAEPTAGIEALVGAVVGAQAGVAVSLVARSLVGTAGGGPLSP